MQAFGIKHEITAKAILQVTGVFMIGRVMDKMCVIC
jgi:hypothetical protein